MADDSVELLSQHPEDASSVSNQSPSPISEFDRHARNYDADLMRGIAVSGENRDYFARGRALMVRQCLSRIDEHPRTILDYGCGTGSGSQYLCEMFGPVRLLGVDISEESLQIARQQHQNLQATFLRADQYRPVSEVDLAFCSGVFHHIPVLERASALAYIFRALRPGGYFAFWENNPWNPGTRLVMKRIPFDRDARPLSFWAAVGMLSGGGFEILSTRFLFIFPRVLRWLRPLEPTLSRAPLGAQYQVLCRKPVAATPVPVNSAEADRTRKS
jgi:SAM-dependent methyltransferase